MLYSLLKIAFRHLAKNKFYLAVNMLGMGIAIACAMTSYLLVAYNIEFDSSVDQDRVKNIVKVVHHRKDEDGDNFKELVAPMALGPVAAHDISGITRFSRFFSDGGYLNYGEMGFHETIFFADSAFLRMFEPKLISGSYDNFRDKNSIFISQKFAIKYFGNEDAVGKILDVSINNKVLHATVGGVLKDAPFNSTFVENALMRSEAYFDLYDFSDTDWSTRIRASLLFELNDLNQSTNIESQFNKYVALRNEARPLDGSQRYELLPFSYSVSPNDMRQSDLHLRIPIIALVIFMTLGAIILLIAAFNLTNTTLALSGKRMKEIGIRKVSGSDRWQIGAQLFAEVLLTVSLSVVAGCALSLYLIPEFAAMWELPFGLPQLSRFNFFMALLVLLFFVSMMSGIYPALFGSRQSPLALFKSNNGPGGSNAFTRTLLVLQFTLCIVVLIAGTVFTQNAVYQDKIPFGYDKDKIITAIIQGSQEATALADVLQSNRNIEATSPSTHHFAFINAPEKPAFIGSEKLTATVYEIGENYLTTVGIGLLKGRMFNEHDTTRNEILVDESFVRRNGLKEPLGAVVTIEEKRKIIVGVVGDHLTDLESDRTENYVYQKANADDYQVLIVRAEGSNIKETEQYIEREWKKLFPGKPLRTDLQNEILYLEANAYNRNLSKIFLFMTILGCILSVSGLYSLASLNMQRRTKEIAVRKIHGASIARIVKLMNVEFAIMLSIAALLGAFGGFKLTDALLGSLFRQHIGIDPITVILCGLAVVLVGITSTSLTILSTANANPVNALRSV